jgi:hypothetical protein
MSSRLDRSYCRLVSRVPARAIEQNLQGPENCTGTSAIHVLEVTETKRHKAGMDGTNLAPSQSASHTGVRGVR